MCVRKRVSYREGSTVFHDRKVGIPSRESLSLSWLEEDRIQDGIDPSSCFYLYRTVTVAPANMTATYLELVGPLRLRISDKRNGESRRDYETLGEIHVMV
jgi:hypothetical protein